MSITSYAVRHPVTTVATTLAVVLLGSVSVTRLPVSLLPAVELPVLTIRTNYTGAAATEVSRFIAEPIEQAIAATPGLVELRSVSRNGQATTIARFAWGTEMQSTVLNVREKLDNARGVLPEGAERPTLLTSDPGERPIAVLSLTGKGDLRSLARAAEDVHARRLEQLEGVASVAVVGEPEDEIQIAIDPDRLRSMGLSPENVAQAVRAGNANGAGGTIRRGQFRFSVRAFTEFRSLSEIAETPIPIGPASAGAGGLKLRDLADVSLTSAEPKTITRLDGAPAIGLVVYKDAGSNTVAVTKRISTAVNQLSLEFPDITMTVVAAQAEFVSNALSNLWQEIWLGGLLSLLVILVFLRDLRVSMAIALMVPLSVLMALVILQGLDVSINVLSLGGLALGVGLLVDNAIVVAEAAGHGKASSGAFTPDTVISSTQEVAGPLIAGTLTTLLVFGPIIFVSGLAAALFRDLSLSVVTSVGASLVLALTLMPVMIAGRRKSVAVANGGAPRRGWIARTSSRFSTRFNTWADRVGERWANWYELGMGWALDHPRRVFGAAIVITAATVYITAKLPREILPRVDERMVVASMQLAEGTALDESTRQAARIEDAARTLGASGIYTRVGVATDEEVLSGAEPGSSATAQLLIPVPDGAKAEEFANELRARVPDLAQGALALDLAGQSEFGSLIGREGRIVRAEVSAATLEEAQRWADTVRSTLRAIPTLTDVRNSYASTQPLVEVELDRARIAQRGVSIDEVANALSGGLGGVPASELRETDRHTPITVRFAGTANENLASALSTVVGGVPVGQFVTYRETRAPIEVVRVGQRPVTIVEGLIERGGTSRATKDVTNALNALALPPGVTWRVTGADVEQRRTTEQLGFVALLSVALVFLVLAGEFASFTVPLVVMLTVPLAAVGGFLLLWATGQSVNAVSLIGIVVMIGMADNEAVVKLDAIRRFRELGHPLREAVMLGGRRRLRAIAMTSLTTITGVLPLAFNIGSGGALYQPLAAGVIGGSVSTLLVTFFLLPVAYVQLEKWREARALVTPPEGVLASVPAGAGLTQPAQQLSVEERQ